MNFLTDLFNEIDEQNKPATQEQEKPVDVKTKLLDFEKMIADAARSSGVQPRTYLEQLCTKNPKFAESKLVKSLLGIVETEQESTMTVTNADKNANSKAWQRYKAGDPRYKYDKDAVPEQEQTNEDEHSAVMDILAKHPAEYKALKDGESLYDQANLFDALFQYFSATGDMPYGTQKARDGDPYEWIEDKLDDLDLLENVAEEETASSRQDLESSLNNLYNILTTINSDDQSDALQSKEEELMADELIGTIAEFKARIEGDVGSFADESVEESAEDAARLLKSVVEDALDEAKKKPIPTSPDKWSRAKAKARSKFDVYPSAYANAYAAKEYKKMGGGWRMGKKKKK